MPDKYAWLTDTIVEGPGYGYDSKKAKGLIRNWQQFIKDQQNELDAIQLIYQQLEKNKVKDVPPRELLTNIISLIRFSTGISKVLEPFAALVNTCFDNGLKQQPQPFKPEQLAWLNRIKDQIAQNTEMTVKDFEYTPFNQEGGLLKARELFGEDLNDIIQGLNGYLIA